MAPQAKTGIIGETMEDLVTVEDATDFEIRAISETVEDEVKADVKRLSEKFEESIIYAAMMVYKDGMAQPYKFTTDKEDAESLARLMKGVLIALPIIGDFRNHDSGPVIQITVDNSTE